MPALRMYGLNKCSTCKAARDALAQAGWQVAFRDVKDEPLSQAERTEMLDLFGEKLINRASLTWRGFSEAERALPSADLIAANPSVMKRPAIIAGDKHTLGWTANVKRAFGVPV
ncbi:arsenate reductase family protein [Paracoccus pacificus]|uniref:Arsenate reductase family protein n=1 Tax=Paracoccus pacificus TaxID=1463598 RepID=A0ABW4R538_9RHOB